MLLFLLTSTIVSGCYVPLEAPELDSSPTAYILCVVPVTPIYVAQPESPHFQFPATPSFCLHTGDSSPSVRSWPRNAPDRNFDATSNIDTDNIPTQVTRPWPSIGPDRNFDATSSQTNSDAGTIRDQIKKIAPKGMRAYIGGLPLFITDDKILGKIFPKCDHNKSFLLSDWKYKNKQKTGEAILIYENAEDAEADCHRFRGTSIFEIPLREGSRIESAIYKCVDQFRSKAFVIVEETKFLREYPRGKDYIKREWNFDLRPQTPCKFFTQDRCKYGAACRFSHE